MIREKRTFDRSYLLCAELKADSILRGATIQRATIQGATMQGATMRGARKSYVLGARKEVRIVKYNER